MKAGQIKSSKLLSLKDLGIMFAFSFFVHFEKEILGTLNKANPCIIALKWGKTAHSKVNSSFTFGISKCERILL